MNFLAIFITFLLNLLYADDVVLKAMRDEVVRNYNKLYDKEFSKPYFISYSVYDNEVCGIDASFGGIKSTYNSKKRIAKIDLRIGNSDFDNSNFITEINNFKPDYSYINIEDNYDAIRWGLWYLTDEAYKNACETLSRKKAYRQKRDIKELYPEISFTKPVNLLIDDNKKTVLCNNYISLMKDISQIAKRYPNIRSIEFSFSFQKNIMRYADSNNSYFKRPITFLVFNIDVEIQDEKNYVKTDSRDFIYMDEDEFRKNIISDVESYLDMFSKISKPIEIDYFLGPCVFEKDAAAQFINYLFVRNISFYPIPETEYDKYIHYYYDIPKLVERVKRRVFPGFIKVYDDPLISRYNSISLAGSYQIDDEGVMPYRLMLVNNGILENIYSSKRPSKYFKTSNGRGRGRYDMYIYPFSSNVFVESERGFKDEEFLKKVYGYAKEQGYDEVAFIERLSSKFNDKDRGLPSPLVVYLLDIKTGEKRYLTNVDFEGVTLRMLRDIDFTSDKKYVYNFFQQGPFYYSSSVLSSLIIPEKFFVREVEIVRSHNKPEKKPYVEHPYFSNSNSK